jgi:hypothetical protein
MEGAKLVAHRGTQLVRYEDPAQYGPPGANDRFFTVRRSPGRISSCLPYRIAFKNKRIRETSPEGVGLRWDIS